MSTEPAVARRCMADILSRYDLRIWIVSWRTRRNLSRDALSCRRFPIFRLLSPFRRVDIEGAAATGPRGRAWPRNAGYRSGRFATRSWERARAGRYPLRAGKCDRGQTRAARAKVRVPYRWPRRRFWLRAHRPCSCCSWTSGCRRDRKASGRAGGVAGKGWAPSSWLVAASAQGWSLVAEAGGGRFQWSMAAVAAAYDGDLNDDGHDDSWTVYVGMACAISACTPCGGI